MAKGDSNIDMSKFQKAMEAAIKEVESASTMRALGEEMVTRIQKRTRLGKGVSQTGAEPQSLKPLSDSYKAVRKGKIAFFTSSDGVVVPYTPQFPPRLSQFTSPGKSNLTFTNQMLDAMSVISARVGSAIISFKGIRKSAFGNNSRLTNRDVASFVSKERPFLNLSKAELNGLSRLIRERIEKALKKLRA